MSGGKIDAHAHVYTVPAPSGAPSAPRADQLSSPQEHLDRLTAHGIAGGLIVQATCYGNDHSSLFETLAAGGKRFKGIAGFPVDTPREEVVKFKERGIIGVRFPIGPHPDPLSSPAGRKMLALLHELDLFTEINVASRDIAGIIEPLRESKGKLIIDHLAWPDVTLSIDQPGFRDILELAQSPRVFVKIGNLIRISRQPYPFDDVTPFVRATIDAFTIDRCLWGSAFPFSGVPQGTFSYGKALAAFEHHVPDLAEREAILVKNPARILGFDLSPVTAA